MVAARGLLVEAREVLVAEELDRVVDILEEESALDLELSDFAEFIIGLREQADRSGRAARQRIVVALERRVELVVEVAQLEKLDGREFEDRARVVGTAASKMIEATQSTSVRSSDP